MISGGEEYSPPVFDNKGIIKPHKIPKIFNFPARLARHHNQRDSRPPDPLKRRERARHRRHRDTRTSRLQYE